MFGVKLRDSMNDWIVCREAEFRLRPRCLEKCCPPFTLMGSVRNLHARQESPNTSGGDRDRQTYHLLHLTTQHS